MDKVLVIQMARMGDFLQTTPLLCGIKKTYPGCRTYVLIDAGTREVAAHCPYADEVLSIDTEKIYGLMSAEDDPAGLYGYLKNELSYLCGLEVSTVININYSLLTTILSSMPKAENVLGYSFNSESRHMTKAPWFSFLNAAVKHRPLSPFNLVDYFYYLCCPAKYHPKKLSFDLVSRDVVAASGLLSAEGISESSMLVAFQLGTRHEQRQWPAAQFAALAGKLLEHENMQILLLGSSDDRRRGDDFMQQISSLDPKKKKRIHDTIGKTKIAELAALLMRSHLLITCDTGTMHLASAVGTKVLSLFFGPAYAYNTGPYGPNSWVMQVRLPCGPCLEDKAECNDLRCRDILQAADVASLAEHILFNSPCRAFFPSPLEVLTSGFDCLGLRYASLEKKELTVPDIQNLCYRQMGQLLMHQPYEAEASGQHDFYLDDSCGNISLIKPEIREIIRQGEILMSRFYSQPEALRSLRLDEAMKFWHPWIDCCQELQGCGGPDIGSGYDNARSSFLSGLYAGTGALKRLVMN